jgi:hypothetical protein
MRKIEMKSRTLTIVASIAAVAAAAACRQIFIGDAGESYLGFVGGHGAGRRFGFSVAAVRRSPKRVPGIAGARHELRRLPLAVPQMLGTLSCAHPKA